MPSTFIEVCITLRHFSPMPLSNSLSETCQWRNIVHYNFTLFYNTLVCDFVSDMHSEIITATVVFILTSFSYNVYTPQQRSNYATSLFICIFLQKPNTTSTPTMKTTSSTVPTDISVPITITGQSSCLPGET